MSTLPMIRKSPLEGTSVLVVLSGGQDSITCLGYALKNYERVVAVGFDYGQKHDVELKQAAYICEKHNVPFTTLTVSTLAELGNSALLKGAGDVNAEHATNSKLPASFVPNRNALFLTLAHAYAQKVGVQALMTGVCETDFSGYPDCRRVFVDAMELALNMGAESDIVIETPLMYIDKADTFKLAEDCDFLATVIVESHTCYNGVRDTLHPWGYGCAECPACQLRAAGYREYLNRYNGEA